MVNALLLAWLVVSSLSGVGRACDWPQIHGPLRNGQAVGERAIAAWPASGPKTVWQSRVGQGYAGPAVVGNRVILFHRVDDVERVEAFDARTGKSLWQSDFRATYVGGFNPDNGPRCVPLVHESSVYVFGAAGDLHCVDLVTGKKRWSRAAYREFAGREGYFGAGSAPIVADGKLLVNVGGDGAGVVAFDLRTGQTLWQATDEAASYSSPTLGQIDGEEHVIFVTRMNTVSLNPANGAVRFQFPFGRRGPTVNAATPMLVGGRLFVSSSYGVGARLSRVTDDSAQQIWANDDSMSSQYATCVHHQGNLFGTHGREDFNNCEFRCIALGSGVVRWKQPGFPHSHSILVGDQLLLLGVDGTLRLVKADPERYQEMANARISPNVTRSLPALSAGQFYFRDNSGKSGTLTCLELATLPPEHPE